MAAIPGLGAASLEGRGMFAHLSKTETRVLYIRNLLLIALSLVVGLRALFSILASWRSATLSPVRKFTHVLMGFLLAVELSQCVVWFMGMSVAALVDGSLPGAGMNTEAAKLWCWPLGIATYWLDLMNSLCHAVLAWNIWSWVYRRKPVYVLCRQLPASVVLAVLLATGLALVPAFEKSVGLTPHSHCFLHTFWKAESPTLAFIIDRWIVLPICWFFVAIFNIWTVHVLRKEARHLPVSAQRLQTRLLLVTFAFCLLWGMMVVPVYLHMRTFAADFLLRWNLALPFVDAVCYGFPESLDVTRLCTRCFPPLVPRLPAHRLGQREDTGKVSSRWVSLSSEMPRFDRFNGVEHGEAGAGSRMERVAAFLRRNFSSPSSSTNNRLSPHRIFITTFDTHYQPLPRTNLFSLVRRNHLAEGLEHWVPLGAPYHLYAIGVQQSCNLSVLRESLHEYLGGPMKYTLVATAELNDAMHTSKLALMLFVRTVDVESGAFRLIGLNTGPVRTSHTGCKGMVGLAFRFYDQSVAIVNAHLPALGQYSGDESFKTKHVAAMLQDLRMNSEHESFDSHLQYHHVIVMGNLNYHVHGLSPRGMLAKISDSARACQSKLEKVRRRGMGWSWRTAGYNRLWSTSWGKCPWLPDEPEHGKQGVDEEFKQEEDEWDPGLEMGLWGVQHEVVEEEETLVEVANRAWSWVYDVDNLQRQIREGRTFSGFSEPPICFPPTFKWHPGADAADFTVPAVVGRAYNTHKGGPGGVEEGLDIPPSYTDRILYHSVEDMAHRFVPLAYDALEKGPLATISDHRPVAAAFMLLLDTAQPLNWYSSSHAREDVADFGHAVMPTLHFPYREEEESYMANAMARAARARRISSFVPITPPLPLYQPPVAKPHFPPLLVSICLGEFRFRFAGFKNLEGFGGRGGGRGGCAAAGGGGHPRSSPPMSPAHFEHRVRWEGDEREKEEDEGECKHQQQEEDCPPNLVLPTLQRSNSSDVSWISGITEGEYGSQHGESKDAAVSKAIAGLVVEVVVLYPLPCEDPLWCFRHYQSLEESLQVGRHAEGTHGATTSAEASLRNLRHMRWRKELEADGEGSGLGPCAGGGARGSRLEMDVLTLGPLPSTQHALIKFLGANKRPLGQGVICLDPDRELLDVEVPALSPTPPPMAGGVPLLVGPSRSAASGVGGGGWGAAPGGGGGAGAAGGGGGGGGGSSTGRGGPVSMSSTAAVAMPPLPRRKSSAESSTASRKTLPPRQTVKLSVGGDYRGTVSFVCDVKVRRRARGGSRLHAPTGDLQQLHGGEGQVTFSHDPEAGQSHEWVSGE